MGVWRRFSGEVIADGVIQKIMAFIAPKLVGGMAAPSPVGDLGIEKMSDALILKQMSFRQVDDDILVEGYLST